MKEQGGRDSVAWRALVIERREIDTQAPRSEPLDHIGKPVREVKLMHLRIYGLVPIKYWGVENNGPCLCNIGRATQEVLDHEAPHGPAIQYDILPTMRQRVAHPSLDILPFRVSKVIEVIGTPRRTSVVAIGQ